MNRLLIILKSWLRDWRGSPQKNWKASSSFFDLKLSTFALLLVAVFQAIIYLRQVKIMNIQAEISKSANEISISTQRASVSVGQVKIEKISVDSGGGKIKPYWKFTPIFSNDGATSTKNLQVKMITQGIIGSFKAEGGLSNLIFFPFRPMSKSFPEDPSEAANQSENNEGNWSGVTAYIGPHGSATISDVAVPEDSLIGSIKSQWPFFITGEIRYEDTFPNTPGHITKFCYAVEGDFSPSGEFTPLRVRLRTTIDGRFA